MTKVFAKIPRTGLGNCMLVWAYALVFAKINNMQLITGRWAQLRWGPLLRRERKSRRYKGYFVETPIAALLFFRMKLFFSARRLDPDVDIIDTPGKRMNYVFQNPFPRRELFNCLVPYEDMIRNELHKMLTPAIKNKLIQCRPPEIAIHVRRGDFKLGNPITPNEFFIAAIRNIREVVKLELSVTIFTDAEEHEISEILALNNVSLSQNKEDILDLLQMCKSKFLVLSLSSSFSYWAAFLSKAFVILHDYDWQMKVKPSTAHYTEFRYRVVERDKALQEAIEVFCQRIGEED